MKIKYKNNQNGQSLMELIVAIGVIVAGVLGILTLIIATILAGKEGSNRIIAINLAREGIEIVRSIRDGNSVDTAGSAWDDGLNGGSNATPIINSPGSTTAVVLDFNHNFNAVNYTQVKIYNDNYYVQGPSAGGAGIYFFRRLDLQAICRNQNDLRDEKFTSFGNCTIEYGSNYDEVGLRVISRVRWPSYNSSKEMTLEERLYDWRI